MQQPTPVQDTLNASSTSTVGQFQPPGIRPRVTTTMWEDEKLCAIKLMPIMCRLSEEQIII